MLRVNEWNTKNVDFTCQKFSGSISDKNARFLAPTFGKNAPLNALSSLDFVLYFTKNSEA